MCGYAQMIKGYEILLVDENRSYGTINVIFDEAKRKWGGEFLCMNLPEEDGIFLLSMILSKNLGNLKVSQLS